MPGHHIVGGRNDVHTPVAVNVRSGHRAGLAIGVDDALAFDQRGAVDRRVHIKHDDVVVARRDPLDRGRRRGQNQLNGCCACHCGIGDDALRKRRRRLAVIFKKAHRVVVGRGRDDVEIAVTIHIAGGHHLDVIGVGDQHVFDKLSAAAHDFVPADQVFLFRAKKDVEIPIFVQVGGGYRFGVVETGGRYTPIANKAWRKAAGRAPLLRYQTI